MLHGFTVEELLTCVRAGLATATAKLSVEEVGSLKRCQVSVWPLTSMRSNRPNGRIVGGLEKVCPDGQRACLGCRHCLHTRGCLSVGGQRGGLWCDKLGVGGAQLARPRMEHRTSRHSLADLVGFTARKHSCPVAHKRPRGSPRDFGTPLSGARTHALGGVLVGAARARRPRSRRCVLADIE